MATLSDIIATAKSQIKNNIGDSTNIVGATAKGARNIVGQDVSQIPVNAIRNITTPIAAGVNSAIGSGLNDIRGAASELMRGNVSGAFRTISNAGKTTLDVLTKTFGIGAGTTLKNPSQSNSVAEGNSLGGALARPDPMLGFNWYAILPDITSIGGNPQKLPWYYVEEASPAFRMFEVRSIFHEGHHKHYPSTYNVDPLSLVIYADEGNEALNYLTAWSGAMLKPTTPTSVEASGGGYGRPQGYKKSVKIILVNAAKKRIATLEYTGCWPTHIDPYALESSASTRQTNRVTFSVDDVFITMEPLNSLSSLDPNEVFVHA